MEAGTGPDVYYKKILARASVPMLAMRALLGWWVTDWMASSCLLQWAMIF